MIDRATYGHRATYKIEEYNVNWVDTFDPYQLMAEAQQARDMLAERYVRGSEFANAYKQAMDFRSLFGVGRQDIKYVCSIGAVYYVQGHHHAQCNLIQALNTAANDGQEPSYCKCEQCLSECGPQGCEQPRRRTIVDINDNGGRDAALAIFDTVIANYAAEIAYAEDMAAQYESKQRISAPFTVTAWGPSSTPVNYGTPTTEVATTKTEVQV